MKKTVLLIIISVFLFPLTAASTYVYKGDDSVITSSDTAIATLPLVVDTSSINEKVFYGFYSGEGTVEAYLSSGWGGTTTEQRLMFKESIIGITGSTYYYKATAEINFYVYIFSNSSYKLSLKWTHLYYKGSKTTYQIPVTISIDNKDQTSTGTDINSATSYDIDTFNPSTDGILIHRDYTYTANTGKYNSFNQKKADYTGYMALTLSTI